MGLIDSHAHLTDEAFDNDRSFIIKDLSNFHVDALINPGCNLEDSARAVELASKYENFYAQVGIHPSDIDDLDKDYLEKLEEMARSKKVVAIGEIGLDYYWRDDNKELQKKVFIDQLNLARKIGLPVVIHTREASFDVYEILKDYGDLKVQIHCFSEDLDLLEKYMDLGFFISIGGVVSFNTGENEKNAAKKVPLDRLMLETDSPYLTPEPYRGLRNDPRRIIEVAKVIADIRGMKLKTLIKHTKKNTEGFFNL